MPCGVMLWRCITSVEHRCTMKPKPSNHWSCAPFLFFSNGQQTTIPRSTLCGAGAFPRTADFLLPSSTPWGLFIARHADTSKSSSNSCASCSKCDSHAGGVSSAVQEEEVGKRGSDAIPVGKGEQTFYDTNKCEEILVQARTHFEKGVEAYMQEDPEVSYRHTASKVGRSNQIKSKLAAIGGQRGVLEPRGIICNRASSRTRRED